MVKKLENYSGEIIRAVRKVHNLDQADTAALLGISQGNISKIEHGLLTLDAPRWIEFCCHFKMDALSLVHGKVEGLLAPSGNFLRGRRVGKFKIPPRYSKAQGQVVRAIYPLIKFCQQRLGREAYLQFIKSVKMDPDYFLLMDNPLNLLFAQDLSAFLEERGVSKEVLFKEVFEVVPFAEAHSLIYEGLKVAEGDLEKVFKRFVKRMPKSYETDSLFEIKSGPLISVQDCPGLDRLKLSDSFKDFRARYQLSQFQALADLTGQNVSLELKVVDRGWQIARGA